MVPHPSNIDIKELNQQLPESNEIPVSDIANPNFYEQPDTSEKNSDHNNQAQWTSLAKTSTYHQNFSNQTTSENEVSDFSLNKYFNNRFVVLFF